ncbi:hypothetical protein SAMN05518672_1011339 [Chitinophaga sp. CF118]|uniref:hypothetical protein n=1 Tax=Chitinophaga sp. CF118 TaxID=1884367 RepID=UPI0008E518F3|nr:hypothetical protein [Chitinophaga sp. CF118]SFD26319.1 hypothetical protein SAMN05518672_1011339 [Chitinophaga sp. CF118]
MSTYILNTAFTDKQLDMLYITGTNVIIAKPTGGGTPNVAWQVFKPMQSNQLSWGEEYGIYASTSGVTNGAILSQLSSVPVGAATNKLYTLEPSSKISGPASGGSAGSYTLLNKYAEKDYMTVGLYQNANVNGTDIIGNALSAAPVLLSSTASMTPYTTVYIWLQSQVISNTVVTTVTSPMTILKFGGEVTEISVAYDSASGKFLPVPSVTQRSIATDFHYLEASL